MLQNSLLAILLLINTAHIVSMEQNNLPVENHKLSALVYIILRCHLKDETLSIEQLCNAAHDNDIKKIEELLIQGIDPNTKNFINETPLHQAAAMGNVDACKLLIKYGANPSVFTCKELNSDTPLHRALDPVTSINKHSNAIAIYFIEECGVNPNIKNKLHNTPLLQTALAGNEEILKFLLQKDAYPNATNIYGSNALHAAALPHKEKSEKIIIECVRELLLLGTDHKKKNKENKTPALCATNELVQKILENDISVNKFIISGTSLCDKNLYKEIMKQQLCPNKKPMHIKKLNFKHTKTLFLSDK